MRDVSRTTQCRWSIGTKDRYRIFLFSPTFAGFPGATRSPWDLVRQTELCYPGGEEI